jgi:hypothetical protein
MRDIKTQAHLDARALIASDLFQEGEITRRECFRLELDAALGEDTGDIKYEKNNEFKDDEL